MHVYISELPTIIMAFVPEIPCTIYLFFHEIRIYMYTLHFNLIMIFQINIFLL